MKSHRCCFTGHRPQKIKRPLDLVMADLAAEIQIAISEGYTTFITGMAQGTDIWAANMVLQMEKHNPNLKLIAAIPFPGYSDNWNSYWGANAEYVLENADLIKEISPHYSASAYFARNKWMVDCSSRVIAVYSEDGGGTGQTVDYARKQKVPVYVIPSRGNRY